MPDQTINTQSAGYQQHLQNLRDIVSFYSPKLRCYFQMTEAQQQAWRQRDPILRELLDFARKTNEHDESV